jgi:hypothetical protein
MTNDAAMQHVREIQAQAERARQDAVNSAQTITLVAGVACALVALGILDAVVLGHAPVQSLAGVALLTLFATLTLQSARSLRRPEHLAREGIAAVAVFERVVGIGGEHQGLVVVDAGERGADPHARAHRGHPPAARTPPRSPT